MEICLDQNHPEKALEIYHGTQNYLLSHVGIQPDKPLQHLGEVAQKQILSQYIATKRTV
ncbi:MAG: hypothetical protein Q9P01_15735 [Anaerolineae bacterium]|nr:hypothetical protein [Anaerolineae bacterium]MDQ7036221.1 hypothetical protein [Anaerolineae bacterium]